MKNISKESKQWQTIAELLLWNSSENSLVRWIELCDLLSPEGEGRHRMGSHQELCQIERERERVSNIQRSEEIEKEEKYVFEFENNLSISLFHVHTHSNDSQSKENY